MLWCCGNRGKPPILNKRLCWSWKKVSTISKGLLWCHYQKKVTDANNFKVGGSTELRNHFKNSVIKRMPYENIWTSYCHFLRSLWCHTQRKVTGSNYFKLEESTKLRNYLKNSVTKEWYMRIYMNYFMLFLRSFVVSYSEESHRFQLFQTWGKH